ALERQAVVGLDDVDALEAAEEVEVPPRTAELTVGRGLEARIDLTLHDLGDLGVLDVAQLARGDVALSEGRASLLDGVGAQEGSDDVGTVRRVHTHGSTVAPRDSRRRNGATRADTPRDAPASCRTGACTRFESFKSSSPSFRRAI